jgi:hypothetical protein
VIYKTFFVVGLIFSLTSCSPVMPSKGGDEKSEAKTAVSARIGVPAKPMLAEDDVRRYFPNAKSTTRKYVCEGFDEETHVVKNRTENKESVTLDVEIIDKEGKKSSKSFNIASAQATLVSFDGKQYSPPSIILRSPKSEGPKTWTEQRGASKEKFTIIPNKQFTVNNTNYDCIGVESLVTEANIGVYFRHWYAIDVGLVAFEWRIVGGGWIEYIMEKP